MGIFSKKNNDPKKSQPAGEKAANKGAAAQKSDKARHRKPKPKRGEKDS